MCDRPYTDVCATLSPERMHAYFSKAKHLPAKTADFIRFLQGSIGTHEHSPDG
jgi:hypothetical protein